MSLFDEAITRLRNQSAADKVKAAIGVHGESRAVSQQPAKQITLDFNSMRAHGYLPEANVAQQFVNQYRRIKRPLIDKAAAAIGPAALDPRVIMVTSALPGDGKTFTSINLAMSMALERDFSVLLVDCDVAKRQVSEVVGMQEERGLVDALVDESLEIESLVTATNLRGLSILPAGTRVDGTAELLSSKRMRQLVATLCTRMPRRLLLLDSPPLLITDEGRALTKIAGQIALVVRAGHTPRQAVIDAIGLFSANQAGGIILNHVNASRADKYYGYGYGSYGPGSNAS
jgi:exopolysaccharide/PEP-CTERM locus tyrosine autokinase